MFRNWGFLLGEIWLLLIIAALIGLFAGWLIWGRSSRQTAAQPTNAQPTAAQPAAATTASEPTSKPMGLTAPRGTPDDLKRIKGIGPELEKLCHSLGYYHFDQIAGWSAGEIAWVDENLEGFKGRVTRDNWVGQARGLMTATSA